MKLDIDGQSITLTCPGCGKKFDEKIGRLKGHTTLPCRHCRAEIRIDATELRRKVDAIKKAANPLGAALGKLGK